MRFHKKVAENYLACFKGDYLGNDVKYQLNFYFKGLTNTLTIRNRNIKNL